MGDLLRLEGPYILAQAVGDGAVVGDEDAGDGGDGGQQDGPVVETKVDGRDEDLVAEATGDEDETEDDHGVGDGLEFGRVVTDGGVA